MSEDETVKVVAWRYIAKYLSPEYPANWGVTVNCPAEPDERYVVEPLYPPDAISSLQDELKRVNALLTASVDDYNTALEEVKRLREARVKPLEWEHGAADAAGGVYEIARYGKYWAVYLNSNLVAEPESEDAAKTAAQADYAARILSALTQ